MRASCRVSVFPASTQPDFALLDKLRDGRSEQEWLDPAAELIHLSAMSKSQTIRQRLIARLAGYWKMEAGNILLVPGAMLFLASGNIGIASIIAIIPMMALLAIGAIYWRAKLRQLEHGISPDETVRRIAMLQTPVAICTAVAAAAGIAAWTLEGLTTGSADRWVATAAAILTVLEYINYYHRQLQHFDHLPDWKRLMNGGGFRKSQLRQDMDRLRSN